MSDFEDVDFSFVQSGDFLVSAYPEQLDCDDNRRELWAYCLRIENNSSQKIRLLRRDFCITDSLGQNHYDLSEGFNGELPDLEPGEYFEFEDTAVIDGRAAVLYGSCVAQNESGETIRIDIPLMQLSVANPRPNKFAIN
ncbi:MAG: ApaG domain [Alphaproteobacteria bacterium]|nr:ApaG domain [Alphaproteobacteria bacterium]